MLASKQLSTRRTLVPKPAAQQFPTQLSHRDFRLLHKMLLELYKHRDLADFKSSVRGILSKVVPFDCIYRARFGLDIQPERGGKRLCKRNRLLLRFLRPHFLQAYRNASLVDSQPQPVPQPLSAYGLSLREVQVARWLAQGKSNPEIALILQISPRTVEKHIERILQKLRVENRATAAVLVAGLTAVS
jgi:DNA-binding CsgD family transcriptional regulator